MWTLEHAVNTQQTRRGTWLPPTPLGVGERAEREREQWRPVMPLPPASPQGSPDPNKVESKNFRDSSVHFLVLSHTSCIYLG